MPATITEVPSSATRNVGRTTWNANDTSLKNTVNALETALSDHQSNGHPGLYPTVSDFNTHKSGSDHDGRYYTEAEVDALIATLVKLTTDQNVDGVKTFLQKVIAKNTTPIYELLDASGNEIGRIIGVVDGENIFRLELWQSGAYKTAIEITKSGGVNFPYHTASVAEKKLATEEYVQARVKTGSQSIYLQSAFLSNANGFLLDGSSAKILYLTAGKRLLAIRVTQINVDDEILNTIEFTPTVNEINIYQFGIVNTTGSASKLQILTNQLSLGWNIAQEFQIAASASAGKFLVELVIGL